MPMKASGPLAPPPPRAVAPTAQDCNEAPASRGATKTSISHDCGAAFDSDARFRPRRVSWCRGRLASIPVVIAAVVCAIPAMAVAVLVAVAGVGLIAASLVVVAAR